MNVPHDSWSSGRIDASTIVLVLNLGVNLCIEKVIELVVFCCFLFWIRKHSEFESQMKQTCDFSKLRSVWEFVLLLLMNSIYRIGFVANGNPFVALSVSLGWRLQVCLQWSPDAAASVMKIEFFALVHFFWVHHAKKANVNSFRDSRFWCICAGILILRNLVDPASSHMLVSKIKPCMSQYQHYHC